VVDTHQIFQVIVVIEDRVQLGTGTAPGIFFQRVFTPDQEITDSGDADNTASARDRLGQPVAD